MLVLQIKTWLVLLKKFGLLMDISLLRWNQMYLKCQIRWWLLLPKSQSQSKANPLFLLDHSPIHAKFYQKDLSILNITVSGYESNHTPDIKRSSNLYHRGFKMIYCYWNSLNFPTVYWDFMKRTKGQNKSFFYWFVIGHWLWRLHHSILPVSGWVLSNSIIQIHWVVCLKSSLLPVFFFPDIK